MEHRSAVESRRRPFGLGSLLYGPALGWLLAIKLKVVLVAIAVAVAMARGSKFWGPGSWGCATSYESPGPWVEEFPGPVKAYQERSDNFESESLTSRVMSGIELAKVGWKAVTESDEQNESCRARLTCEARQIAKESPPLAKMLDVFGASLRAVPYCLLRPPTKQKMMRTLIFLAVVVAVVLAAPAEEETGVAEVDNGMERSSNASNTLTLPGIGDVSLSGTSLLHGFLVGSFALFAVVGLATVLTLILPWFGLRKVIDNWSCALTGSCGYDPYNGNQLAYDHYQNYQQPAPTAYQQQQTAAAAGYSANPSPTYHQRSSDLLNPILQALSSAYERYGPTPVVKA
ncbi:Hypothetical predicted protein [Cloeon dipterum]|uniref:Uncharacterized protein n=2 Tax=Cloeon dipterum TaxID=197152 RepID=A0A8S1BW22_9INSE|nr:Hypothetical predicted protein [Cloeon dipterum]